MFLLHSAASSFTFNEAAYASRTPVISTDFSIIAFSEKEKNIDYLALGHVHEYRSGQLDGRGVWAYSGCPEGRGFDETGKNAFAVNIVVAAEIIKIYRRVVCNHAEKELFIFFERIIHVKYVAG